MWIWTFHIACLLCADYQLQWWVAHRSVGRSHKCGQGTKEIFPISAPVHQKARPPCKATWRRGWSRCIPTSWMPCHWIAAGSSPQSRPSVFRARPRFRPAEWEHDLAAPIALPLAEAEMAQPTAPAAVDQSASFLLVLVAKLIASVARGNERVAFALHCPAAKQERWRKGRGWPVGHDRRTARTWPAVSQ